MLQLEILMPQLETLLLQLVMLIPQPVFDLVNLSHPLYSVDLRPKLNLVSRGVRPDVQGCEQKLEVRPPQTRLLSRLG